MAVPPVSVVGIGASAGGVEALQALFTAMPDPAPMLGFIIVTHLGPDHTSALPSILAACTAMPVHAVADGDEVQAGHAYVLQQDSIVTLSNGALRLREQVENQSREHHPIDILLTSLAKDLKAGAAGIVLSGSGSDGTIGLQAIQQAGGLTIVQKIAVADTTTAAGPRPQYAEMVNSAIAAGAADLIIDVEDIPARLSELAAAAGAARPPPGKPGADAAPPPVQREADQPEPAPAPDQMGDKATQGAIAAVLLNTTGHDFSGYKDRTFFRRVRRRMQVLGLTDHADYIEKLRSDPEETRMLFRDLLIGVTGFFRDPAAFAALQQRVLSKLFKDRDPADTIRVWVPGCASGEEAYSLAILLREQMEAHAKGPAAQIFATDIDEAALAVARRGHYAGPALGTMEPKRLARFFTADLDGYTVSKDLRDICVFSQHNIIGDPPFSRMDLVSCRNLLIYLDSDLQDQVIPLFHYALRPGGLLFLGNAETVARHGDWFTNEDKANHIYRRLEHSASRATVRLASSKPRQDWLAWSKSIAVAPPKRERGQGLRQAAEALLLDQFSPPNLVVSRDGEVVHQSAHLGIYLEPSAGPPSRQLLSLARPGLRLDLRSALKEAVETQRRASRPRVQFLYEGQGRTTDLTVMPLPGREGNRLFLVVFAEPTLPAVSQAVPASAEAASAAETESWIHQDLIETRERLRSVNEEFETATEELTSANEEMVSVNEELQSTNEELETSKEELQSVNEELRTANVELSGKIDELSTANADLHNLFDSTQIATLFLDRNSLIRSFTPAMTSIFNLVQSDRGRPITDFASQLDQVELRREIRQVLSEQSAVERRVSARDGMVHYLMRVLPYRTAAGEVDGAVVTFFDVTKVVEGELLGTLVDELNHRVRNMLQVVQSVATSSLRRATSLTDFGEAFSNRIKALARAHELLSHQGWTRVDLRALIEKELEPYADRLGRVSLSGPAVMLKPKTALSLGMVFHELATNAAKHGALSNASGLVRVTWTLKHAEGLEKLALEWLESGGPTPAVPTRRGGFGTELIVRLLHHELGGRMDVDSSDQRRLISLLVPLASLVPKPVGPAARNAKPSARTGEAAD